MSRPEVSLNPEMPEWSSVRTTSLNTGTTSTCPECVLSMSPSTVPPSTSAPSTVQWSSLMSPRVTSGSS